MKNYSLKDLITILIGINSILIPSYIFFTTSPEEIKSSAIIIFIGISIVSVISIMVVYVYNQWANLLRTVNSNEIEIQKFQKDLKDIEDLFNIEKRVSIMEALIKKKKAQIDPRIVIWIVLIILLLLFLKVSGVFG